MKYKGIYFSLFSLFLKKPMVKRFGKDKTKESLQKGRILYREMLENTEDIGEKNPMAHNIYSAYVFLAVCRAGNFSVEDFREVIAAFMDNRIIRKVMSSIDFNKEKDMKKFAERMHKAEEWAETHPEYQDKTWDFHFDEKRIRTAFIITSQDALWKNSQEKMAILIYYPCAVTLTTLRLNETKDYCIESKRWQQEAQSVITGSWGIKR